MLIIARSRPTGFDSRHIDSSIQIILGILMTGKVGQRFGDQPEVSPISSTADPQTKGQ